MSRGPGRVQTAILDTLLAEPEGPLVGWRTVRELAVSVFGEQPSRAEVESVRRALKRLASLGRVELDLLTEETVIAATRVAAGDRIAYRRRHAATRPVLGAHLALSVEERAAREQHYAARLDALTTLDRRIVHRD